MSHCYRIDLITVRCFRCCPVVSAAVAVAVAGASAGASAGAGAATLCYTTQPISRACCSLPQSFTIS